MVSKIRELYWTLVPYDYRPSNIWYQIKCYAWKRYSTVKSRYLPHTWCDKVELIPHTIMEMLSDFMEKECSPGCVDWYAHPHYILFNNQEWNVRDLMQHIYDWYHQVYIPKSENGRVSAWLNFCLQHSTSEDAKPGDRMMTWSNPVWDSEENKKTADKLRKRTRNIEASLEKQLDEYCIAVIRMRNFMWT